MPSPAIPSQIYLRIPADAELIKAVMREYLHRNLGKIDGTAGRGGLLQFR
jgi:hypothetical protein